MEMQEQRCGFYRLGLLAAFLSFLFISVVAVILTNFQAGTVLLPVLLTSVLLVGFILLTIFQCQKKEASRRREEANFIQEVNRTLQEVRESPKWQVKERYYVSQRTSWYDFVPWSTTVTNATTTKQDTNIRII